MLEVESLLSQSINHFFLHRIVQTTTKQGPWLYFAAFGSDSTLVRDCGEYRRIIGKQIAKNIQNTDQSLAISTELGHLALVEADSSVKVQSVHFCQADIS